MFAPWQIRESGVRPVRALAISITSDIRRGLSGLWYALANHLGAAGGTGGPSLSVVLPAWVLWRSLRILSRRRLDPDHE